MLSKVESGKESSSGRLLRDIEEISKALYLQNLPPSKPLATVPDLRSKSVSRTRFLDSKSEYLTDNLLQKDKKSSIWNWKPLKALTHIRNRRYNCCFYLHVHDIEGLPVNFTDLSVCVNWKRKDEVLRTRLARICQGMAEIEETLVHKCSVYGSRNGPHDSARYKPKLFLLYASVLGAPEQDIGKHWVDLTRLLPLTLEELEEEKRSSGKWMTSFKLAGKAKGAMLNVSFGFSITGDSSFDSSNLVKVPDLLKESRQGTVDPSKDFSGPDASGMLRRLGSVPRNSHHVPHLPTRSLDIQVLNEVFPNRGPELTRSVTFLYQKLDEGKLGNSNESNILYEHLEPLKPKPGSSPESGVENSGNESDDAEFTVIDQGVELSLKDQLKLENDVVQSFDVPAIGTINVAEIFKGDRTALNKEMRNLKWTTYREHNVYPDESTIKELESIFSNLSNTESSELDSSFDRSNFPDKNPYMKTKSSLREDKMVKSLSFDDVTESVANDFMNFLGSEPSPLDLSSDTEPESPRERLLKEFEKDALASGDPIFHFDATGETVGFSVAASTTDVWGDCSDKFDLSLVIKAAEEEHYMVNQSLRNRREAKMLENLETEALMQEWGWNEKAFQNSPRASSGGFGSPVSFSPEEPPELPPLGEGLGASFQTKSGGLLRSMNPSLFRNTKNGESLIMQVSSPVVLPTAMGSNGEEILECWALVGVEKMSLQANELMPLEDVTGKTMQQDARVAALRSEVLERRYSNLGLKTIELEELPSSHSFDNLRILDSSSVCDEVDSGHVFLEDLVPLAVEKIEPLLIEGLRIQSGMADEEAPSSIRLQSIEKASLSKADAVDELIGLAVSFDEWVRLDAGVLGDEEVSDRTSKILEAHSNKYMDLVIDRLTIDGKYGNLSGRSSGFLRNNFIIAVKVQLRDPLRDYDRVGAPMLALIQVERGFVPLRSNVDTIVSERSYDGEEERGTNVEEMEGIIEDGIPWFKITEVHVAGLIAEFGKVWGSRSLQQSGSRWLLSSGLGKTGKRYFSKSTAIVVSSSPMMRKVRPTDTLWSISSHVHNARGHNIPCRQMEIIYSSVLDIKKIQYQCNITSQSTSGAISGKEVAGYNTICRQDFSTIALIEKFEDIEPVVVLAGGTRHHTFSCDGTAVEEHDDGDPDTMLLGCVGDRDVEPEAPRWVDGDPKGIDTVDKKLLKELNSWTCRVLTTLSNAIRILNV
ncbi:hypothetical protein RJ639_029672 [Escallonia herrerae]|uniref:C2 NT-type domain-containing protein n=1 Tax=Escallonia herrerae TaxID=1293975 RepID=A0AA89BCY5_9ASTE|nr:hypothetical protein RJ639_029672 [Escallonia herrerae]